MTRFGAAAALICAALVAGCVTPTSVHPVGTTTGAGRDLTLVGTWKNDYPWRDEGDTLTVAPVGKDGTLMTAFVVNLPEKEDGAGSFHLYEFTVAKAGANHFINARELKPAGEGSEQADNWMPLFYTIKDNGRSAKLYYLDQQKIVAAIESGAIKGVVKKHKTENSDGKSEDVVDTITITAEPAELDAFMARSEAADLFKIYKQYWKVN